MDSIKISLRKKWEPIEPFERALTKPQNKKKLGLGEEEYDVCEQFVHIVDYNGTPPKFVRLTLDEIQELKKDKVAFKNSETKFRTCFLWIIDENEKLKIARENIRNEKRFRDPKYICHTNLSGAKKAYIGGEMFFGEDNNIYINFYSDRYGGQHTPIDLWYDTKELFKQLGFINIIDFEDI